VDFCRVSLTYDGSAISAMLGDVWLDVGKMNEKWLSTLGLRSPDGFHTGNSVRAESLERIANAIDT
jgi:hypothetical protein